MSAVGGVPGRGRTSCRGAAGRRSSGRWCGGRGGGRAARAEQDRLADAPRVRRASWTPTGTARPGCFAAHQVGEGESEHAGEQVHADLVVGERRIGANDTRWGSWPDGTRLRGLLGPLGVDDLGRRGQSSWSVTRIRLPMILLSSPARAVGSIRQARRSVAGGPGQLVVMDPGHRAGGADGVDLAGPRGRARLGASPCGELGEARWPLCAGPGARLALLGGAAGSGSGSGHAVAGRALTAVVSKAVRLA